MKASVGWNKYNARYGCQPHLDNDQIADADPKTLDRDGKIETPRGPTLTKRKQRYRVETRFDSRVMVLRHVNFVG
jgi:hypothetical protein